MANYLRQFPRIRGGSAVFSNGTPASTIAINETFSTTPPPATNTIWLKVAGTWRQCTTWLKVAGTWVQTQPKIKQAGNWQ